MRTSGCICCLIACFVLYLFACVCCTLVVEFVCGFCFLCFPVIMCLDWNVRVGLLALPVSL